MNSLKFVFAAIGLFLSPATVVAQEGACDDVSAVIATTPAPSPVPGPFRFALQLADNPPSSADIVMVGDSMLAVWDKNLKKYFKDKSVFNYSVGGDKTQQVLWRLDKAKFQMTTPNAIVIWVGTNNLSDTGTVACGVFAGLKAIIRKSREIWGYTPIFVVTIPPRGADFADFDDERKALNVMIEGMGTTDGVYPVVIKDDEITEGNYGRPKLDPKTLSCFPDNAYFSKKLSERSSSSGAAGL